MNASGDITINTYKATCFVAGATAGPRKKQQRRRLAQNNRYVVLCDMSDATKKMDSNDVV